MLTADQLRAACGGLNDIADSVLESVAEMALEYAEKYTGRKLEKREYTDEVNIAGKTVLLQAYPVDEIKTISVDGKDVDIDRIVLNRERGIMLLPFGGETARVEYVGGYDIMPRPIACAVGMLAASIAQAAENAGQQITFQALDGYQVTYASKGADGNTLEMLSPVAAVMLKPYCARQGMRVIK